MGRPRKGEIPDKQENFCQEYLVDLNGTQAAIRAGYSPFTAGEQACELLKKPNVRARIDALMAARSMRTEITADVVIRELARIALVNPLDLINSRDATVSDDATVDQKAAIQSVKVRRKPTEFGDEVEREVKLNDKVKALELLGKHLGMYTDKKELSGPGGAAIPLEIVVNYGNSTKPTND
jgi:phage terminase small subunit